MEPSPPQSNLSTLLLAFYDCLTDANQLETLMEMITSWLDDEEVALVSPQLEHHADKAWRLLGELNAPDDMPVTLAEDADLTRFATAAQLEAAVSDQIQPDDIAKLRSWLASSAAPNPLLIRVFAQEATELVILSREPQSGGYLAKRTGPEFQSIISRFVADSFDLTQAELALVQELLQGGTLREIAGRLGKSWETVRSQVKTLTNKLGVNTQADILRLVNQAATLMPTKTTAESAPSADLRLLSLPDGRTICYEIDGPPSDKTLVFLHGMTQGRHWPNKARAYALNKGWRIVRISRAGRGPSSLNPKEGDAILQDNIDDVMAIMDHERIKSFSIFGAGDGFAIGYPLALQYPERVQMIVGLEVVPPILTRDVISAFSGKMKTYGLACFYAPKTVKFMLTLAMRRLERIEDRYNGVHPLLGVDLGKYEDAEGIRVDDLNFQDLMAHQAEGIWRDATFAALDWARAPENTNIRPKAALIHCGNSMIKRDGKLDEFAQRIGAPIYGASSYLPFVTATLPRVLELLDPN